MAATKTSKKTDQKPESGQVEPTPEPASAPAAEPTVAELAQQVRAAFFAAIEARQKDGTVPNDALATVKEAYVRLPQGQRGKLSATLNHEATKAMFKGDGTVDTSYAQAMGTLAGVLAELVTERRTMPHDPVPAVAGYLAALDAARADLLAELTAEQRKAVDGVDVATDEAAQRFKEATSTVLERESFRALTGRKRAPSQTNGDPESPTGGDGNPIRDRILGEIEKAGGKRVMLKDVARATKTSPNAIGNRWAKNNLEGIKCGSDGNGDMWFELA